MDTVNNLLRDSIAALRGARSRAYLIDMSWLLRSVRLALKSLATVLNGVQYGQAIALAGTA
ncbi:MAG TPA: hypothetical protein VFQ98_00985 [Gallionella sp.]|nr:hypothetical protein [Gallionella sp.]